MARAIGIDLGTTNAVAAVMEGGGPTVIINREGQRSTPSVVGFARNGERLVGQLARSQAVQNPESSVHSARRFMGRRYIEVEDEIGCLPIAFALGPADAVQFEVRGERYAPEEIGALVLHRLAEDAARYLGEKVEDAVISVPACFDDAQRRATREAGALAGLNVLRTVDEPEAAALAYGLDGRGSGTILVFDLGGGTFDVSLLQMGSPGVELVATAGHSHLGGDDFDRRVVDWMADEFQRDHGIDLRRDRQALQRLTEAAEGAKVELSSSVEAAISLPFVTADGSGPLHLALTLTRARFDQLTADLVEACVQPFLQALSGARLTGRDIDEVLLVGGSTRIPAVQALVRRLTGRKKTNQSLRPDEVVAMGASILAAVLAGETDAVFPERVKPRSRVIGSFPSPPAPRIERHPQISLRAPALRGANDNECAAAPRGEASVGEAQPDVVDALYWRQ